MSYLHVFTYSERPDTPAINMDFSVDKKERANRSKMLHILSDKKKELFYTNHANSVQDVLIESSLNGQNIGWTKNYIRVNIQSEVNLENNIEKVHLENFQNQMMNGNLVA